MKPFKETKLGIFLKEKAPHILDKVSGLLPDSGVLGIVKNLVHSDPDILPEDKLEFAKLEQDFQIELIKDTQNARSREVEFVKAVGHIDYLMWFLAVSAVGIFGFMTYMVLMNKIEGKNENLIFHIFGIVEGFLLSVFSYYFGSSAGSRVKDMKK